MVSGCSRSHAGKFCNTQPADTVRPALKLKLLSSFWIQPQILTLANEAFNRIPGAFRTDRGSARLSTLL